MPLYEFECRTCRERFEDLVRSSVEADQTVECPACGAKDAVRLLSAFSTGGGSSSYSGGGGGGCSGHGGFS